MEFRLRKKRAAQSEETPRKRKREERFIVGEKIL